MGISILLIGVGMLAVMVLPAARYPKIALLTVIGLTGKKAILMTSMAFLLGCCRWSCPPAPGSEGARRWDPA